MYGAECCTWDGDEIAESLRQQELFESVHLVFQLSDQTSVWILVDNSVTLDLFGPVGIPVEERRVRRYARQNLYIC